MERKSVHHDCKSETKWNFRKLDGTLQENRRTRDEAKDRTLSSITHSMNFKNWKSKSEMKKANLIITGIPTKVEPGVNLEELIKKHVTQEKEQRPIAVEIQYDENNTAQIAMATFESEEHTEEALKTANHAMAVLKSEMMRKLMKSKDQAEQIDYKTYLISRAPCSYRSGGR